ncbi:MAG: U32 family peptidase [Peptococcaceae bacterium]|nr:U32 family peptidase [Peptococcaceae bacterium]
MKIHFELNTQIASPAELRRDVLEPYQAVYLGNPFCPRYKNNLLEDLQALKQGVALAHDLGKKAYVTTYAAPATEDLPHILRIVEAAVDAGADAVEAHNLGVIRLIAGNFPGTAIHSGGLANVYTSYGAAHLAGMGVKRITPHYELSLEEIKYIRDAAGTEVEILLHGKMPLGITRDCFMLTVPGAPPCPEACGEEFWLRHKDWVLRPAGTIMLSGRDVCMLEHLPFLTGAGYRVFRIEALFENAEYKKEVGGIYGRALESLAEGEAAGEALAGLLAYNRHGFCNGFYFGRSGRDYVALRGREG